MTTRSYKNILGIIFLFFFISRLVPVFLECLVPPYVAYNPTQRKYQTTRQSVKTFEYYGRQRRTSFWCLVTEVSISTPYKTVNTSFPKQMEYSWSFHYQAKQFWSTVLVLFVPEIFMETLEVSYELLLFVAELFSGEDLQLLEKHERYPRRKTQTYIFTHKPLVYENHERHLQRLEIYFFSKIISTQNMDCL